MEEKLRIFHVRYKQIGHTQGLNGCSIPKDSNSPKDFMVLSSSLLVMPSTLMVCAASWCVQLRDLRHTPSGQPVQTAPIPGSATGPVSPRIVSPVTNSSDELPVKSEPISRSMLRAGSSASSNRER